MIAVAPLINFSPIRRKGLKEAYYSGGVHIILTPLPRIMASQEKVKCSLRSKIVSFQSISDLNGAIASLDDSGQKISCEFSK